MKGINPSLKDWHPKWTTLKINWSLSGRWVGAPIYKDTKGDDPKTYRVARIEKYIDIEGKIREVLAYGAKDVELLVWYDIDDIKATFSNWIIPEESRWENTRDWNPDAKKAKDIQRTDSRGGGRGNPRGNDRGRGRGNRGNARGTARGNGRGN